MLAPYNHARIGDLHVAVYHNGEQRPLLTFYTHSHYNKTLRQRREVKYLKAVQGRRSRRIGPTYE